VRALTQVTAPVVGYAGEPNLARQAGEPAALLPRGDLVVSPASLPWLDALAWLVGAVARLLAASPPNPGP